MDTLNKSARFSSNILGDTTLQSLKSEKTRKISLVPTPRHGNLADLFLILPGQLQMSSKRFHLYSFIKLSKNKILRPFFSHYCWMVAMETTIVMKILVSVFGEYWQVAQGCKVWLWSDKGRKCYLELKFLNFLFLTTLTMIPCSATFCVW